MSNQNQIKLGSYFLKETIGVGTFGKVKGPSLAFPPSLYPHQLYYLLFLCIVHDSWGVSFGLKNYEFRIPDLSENPSVVVPLTLSRCPVLFLFLFYLSFYFLSIIFGYWSSLDSVWRLTLRIPSWKSHCPSLPRSPASFWCPSSLFLRYYYWFLRRHGFVHCVHYEARHKAFPFGLSFLFFHFDFSFHSLSLSFLLFRLFLFPLPSFPRSLCLPFLFLFLLSFLPPSLSLFFFVLVILLASFSFFLRRRSPLCFLK